jgi:glyceraldehyde-3-phosphate dehydrogenase (NAD(P))
MPKLRVCVNGYGTIGKRVADALSLQSDMIVEGVVKTKADQACQLIQEKGYPLYAASSESLELFRKANLKVEGVAEDLFRKCDVVIDCTPEGVGAKYKGVYEGLGVKAIFQGGEKHNLVDASFVAEVNYDKAVNKNYVRVVSCNTTGLSRTIGYLDRSFGVQRVRATIIRRGADPSETKKGPINALIPNPARFPSHHGPDVQTVLPHVEIVTGAVVSPTTLMHVHVVNAELKTEVSVDDVIGSLSKSKRIRLVEAERGLDSTAAIIEYARDMGRKRGDLPEVAVWRESISVIGREVYYMQAVHQESIVVPENIDAVRSVTGTVVEAAKSIDLTNKSLGLV